MEFAFLLDTINQHFPPETAMDGDKIGIQIQCNSNKINGILIALEVNDEVVDECVKLNYNTIITFHPLIYIPLTNITYFNRVGRICTNLIRNSINLISIHTTFDSFYNGTSKILADMLGLTAVEFLAPDAVHENCGIGIIAKPNKPITSAELVENVHNICNSPIRFCEGKSDCINKIAIVGGSGVSFMKKAIFKDCDAFITADITYHTFHATKNEILLIDAGHYEMEQFVPKGIANALNDFLVSNNISFKTSEIVTNPIQYFPTNDYNSKQQKYLLK